MSALPPQSGHQLNALGCPLSAKKRTRHRARNRCLLLHRAAAFGPVLEPAEVVNALIAHVFENLAAERRATAGAAIDDHILILVKTLVVRGRIRIGAKFQQAARNVHGASDLAALLYFQCVAHVDDKGITLRNHVPRLRWRDPRHCRIGGIHHLFQVCRHVCSSYASALLRWRAAKSLDRPTSGPLRLLFAVSMRASVLLISSSLGLTSSASASLTCSA